MPVLSVSNLFKSYIVETILEDINFNLEDGDKVGVLGLNGTGKTTLIEIISGALDSDSGTIMLQKGLSLGYLKQHTKIESSLTIFNECLKVFDDLILMEERIRTLEVEISSLSEENPQSLEKPMSEYGHLLEEFNSKGGYEYKSRIKGVLKGLGFIEEDFDKNVDILSGGQKSRVSLAKLLLENPDLLLLDEPTNHLDISAIAWLEKFLNDYSGAALIISHDRYFLDNVVNKIFFMENKKLYQYNTNYSGFMVQRKKDLELMNKQFEDQQKEIKRQEEIIQRYIRYGGERYIRQARSRQKMLDRVKILPKHQDSKKTRLKFDPEIKSGNDVLFAENISKSFDDFKLIENISLAIYKGDKVGLIGPNGIGKTTLFKIILGQISYDSGEIRKGHNVQPGYFDQEMEGLNPENSIVDEIWDSYPSLNHYQIRTYLSQFLFVGDDIFKEIGDLSGGEKARVALLKLMLSKSNLLLMDEPTNHLDIDSKEVLEDALNDYSGTLFVISHDRYFLNQVVNKIFELTPEGLNEYLGNYDYYVEKKQELNYIEEEDDPRTKTQIRLEKKKEKELIQQQRDKNAKIKEIENCIANYEKELEKIDESLSNPNIYEDHQNVLTLGKNREKLKHRLDDLYDQWMELTE